jgi:orotate phosphoribosyltransferase
MEDYKKQFIEFLVKNDALKFGEFTLKSGRISPYFINTGMFNDGLGMKTLASYYAKAVKSEFGEDFDVLYGPAYKGIPLCVSVSMELSDIGVNKSYSFDRKEKKNHGEGGAIGGASLEEKDIIIIDDVITAGTAIREAVDKLKWNGNPNIKGIIISVNRKEKGTGEKSAIQEIEKNLSVKVVSIIDFDEIKEYCHNREIGGKVYVDDDMYVKMNDYKEKYGV